MGLAFRPSFLFGAFWAVISISIWLLTLTTGWQAQTIMPMNIWHAHEMLFGFGALIATGFLMTAGQNWTGVAGLSGKPLLLLTLTWLLARFAPFIADHSLAWIILFSAQTIWWLGCIVSFSRQIILSRNTRNAFFIALLTAMMMLNIAILLAAYHQQYLLANHLCQSMILVFTLLMSIVGGRVIPFFTNITCNSKNRWLPSYFERLVLISTIVSAAGFIFNGFLPFKPGWLMIVAGVLQLIRLYSWHHKLIWKTALLWSLHVSYLGMAIGLILLGISDITQVIPFIDTLHIIAIIAMAGMILGMMSRVSLGHTGRPLRLHKIMTVSFIAVFLAGTIRTLVPQGPDPLVFILLSGGLWLIGFMLFIYLYFPVLTQARLDGREG